MSTSPPIPPPEGRPPSRHRSAWANRCGPLRGRAPKARDKDGFSLLEVIIATLIVALVSVAVLTSLQKAGASTADSRAHAQAAACAQQDQERLRGLSQAQLAKIYEQPSHAETRELTDSCEPNKAGARGTETIFTVTSTVSYVNDSTDAAPGCTSSSEAADYLQTTSSVRWGALDIRSPDHTLERPAVTESSIVATPAGASVLAKVVNQNGAPVSGATITLKPAGGASTQSQATGTEGCAIFGSLESKSTVEATASKSGYITPSGETSETQSETLGENTGTTTKPFVLAPAGSIDVKFPSGPSGGGETFVVVQSKMKAPNFDLGGTTGTRVPGASIGNLYPFTGATHQPEGYAVYAGDCTANAPPSTVTTPTAEVGEAGTQTVEVEEPPVTVTVYNKTASSTEYASGATAKITNTACSNVVPDNLTSAPSVVRTQTITSTGALPYPDLPYGTFTLCVSKSYSGTTYSYTTTFTNGDGEAVPPILLETSTDKNKSC